jgi:hypothetical protein
MGFSIKGARSFQRRREKMNEAIRSFNAAEEGLSEELNE